MNLYYGEETLHSVENFALKHKKADLDLIHGIVLVKKAAAISYKKLGMGEEGVYDAIIEACDDVLEGKYDEHFVTEALQGGAGTSMNMNVNEVLATLASEKSGLEIHYLDDVNRGQSTNDVCPTGLRIAAIALLRELGDACADLQATLEAKEKEYAHIEKLGRTQLMDAVPITLGSEFGAYARAINRDRARLRKADKYLHQVNLGGTAVGMGTNADPEYKAMVVKELSKLTGMELTGAECLMDLTQNNDVFAEVSGALKALAVNLVKIAGDLRLMNAGPLGGFGEIRLAKMQKGSTIMPGKVNPVMAEMIMQVGMRVMANDTLVGMAASRGEFELNAFFPVIADSLMESLRLLIEGVKLFNEKCVKTLVANEERCQQIVDNTYAFATKYAPKLGYDRVAEIISICGTNVKQARMMMEEESKNIVEE